MKAGIVVGIDPGLDEHGVVALVGESSYRLERRMISTAKFMSIALNRRAPQH